MIENRLRILGATILPLIAVILIAGIGIVATRSSPILAYNPGPDLILDEAKRIRNEKGFLYQDTRELIITTSAAQMELNAQVHSNLANSLTMPLWAGVGLLGGLVVSVSAWVATNTRRSTPDAA